MVTCLTGGTAVVIIIALSVIQPCGASGLSRALSGKKDVPSRNAQPCCQDFRKSWNCELRRRHTARAKRRTTWGIDSNGCGNREWRWRRFASATPESPADPARHAHSVKRSASAEISSTAGRQQGKRHEVKQNGSGIDECSWSGQPLLGVQNSRRNLAPSIDLPR